MTVRSSCESRGFVVSLGSYDVSKSSLPQN